MITGLNTKKNTYAFGMPMPGRNYNSSNYSYGFGGKRKDDEIAGNGNYYDYDARMYDPRLGRTPSGTKSKEIAFIQYLFPVGSGPSSNKWPK